MARHSIFAILFCSLLVACSGRDKPSSPHDGIVLDSVDQALFEQLFATPTSAELSSATSRWGKGDFSALDAKVVLRDTFSVDSIAPDSILQSEIWVVSHTSDGFKHYGAVVFPLGVADSLPVLLHCHWGDGGVNADSDFRMILGFLGDLKGQFIHVIPSFRSERLEYADSVWVSEGSPSPWKDDVLDALRLVAAVESLSVDSTIPRIQNAGRRAIGFSRGGGVALLAALQDSRYDRVVDYFGPTDFFGEFAQDVFLKLLAGQTMDLPGVRDLDSSIAQPLQAGTLSVDSARQALLVRSPARFASLLPQVMIHHGTLDSTVPISQSDALWDALQKDNPTHNSDSRYFAYPGAGHSPLGMFSKIDSTIGFLSWKPGLPKILPKKAAFQRMRMPGFDLSRE
jgi:predicted esterase